MLPNHLRHNGPAFLSVLFCPSSVLFLSNSLVLQKPFCVVSTSARVAIEIAHFKPLAVLFLVESLSQLLFLQVFGKNVG